MRVEQFFGPFPIIELGDIILREITSEDAESYLNYMGRKEMIGFLTKDHIPKNIDGATEEVKYWASLFPGKKSIYWAIALKDNNKMIGTAGFNVISYPNSRAEISYDLSPDYWGKGVMLKTIKAILQYSDYSLGLVRVQATVITDNDRSIKVLERTGFSREGSLKKYEVVEGEHKDYYMYARVQ